jgi:tetratricopeptide (TPR) repeat protein
VTTIKDGKMRLATEAETPAEALTAYRTTTALRALTRAVNGGPGNRLAAAAYLELGNLEARAGHLKEAGDRYERLLYEFRNAPVVIEACYNLGQVLLKQGHTIEGRAAFFAARDQAPGHELASLALFQIGRTYLLENDPEKSIKPFNDALAVAAGTPVEAAAALNLAAAHLMTGKPKEASRTVREHRAPVEQPPYRATAIFLDAYAQFLMFKGKDTARQASELLAALWAVGGKEPVLGAVGPLLVGRAYRDLDQPDEMIATYQKALPGLKGALAAEMSLQVADDLYDHGKFEAARKFYAPLAATEGNRWAADAQLKLAHIALLENRPQETLQACRKLLEDRQSPKRQTVLLLMGQAYEKTGEYLKAATCFKGQSPD